MFLGNSTRDLQTAVDSISYGVNLPLVVVDGHALRAVATQDLLIGNATDDIRSCYRSIRQTVAGRRTERVEGRSADPTPTEHAPHDEGGEIPQSIAALAISVTDSASTTRDERMRRHEIANLEDRFFKTRLSNAHPLEYLFRLSPEWRWFELISMNEESGFFDPSDSGIKQTAVYGIEGWDLYVKRLTGAPRYLVVAGPLRSSVGGSLEDYGEKEIDRRIVEAYSRFHDRYCRESITRRFSDEEMVRAARQRKPITRAAIEGRLSLAEKVISEVAKSCDELINGAEQHPQTHLSTIQSATERFLAVGRLAQSRSFYERALRATGRRSERTTPEEDRSGRSVDVQFAFRVDSEDEMKRLLHCSIEQSIDPEDQRVTWRYTGSSRLATVAREPEPDPIAIRVNGNEVGEMADIRSAEEKAARWSETLYLRRKSDLGNRSNLIGTWMGQNFLTTTNQTSREIANAEAPAGQTSDSLSVYDSVCEYIAESTRTEMCQIYRYYPHIDGGTMRVLGRSVTGSTWSVEDSDAVCSHMAKVENGEGPESDPARISIVYLTAKTKQLQYLNGKDLSEIEARDGEDLQGPVTWPGDVVRPCAIAAAPILVEGRVWGVVEIATVRSGAIERHAQHSLSDYGSVLAAYFFGITYNQNIRSLGLWGASEFSQSPDEISSVSTMFADKICRIGLANAAIILLQVSGEGGCVYDIKGFAGTPDYSDRGKELELDLKSDRCRHFLSSYLWHEYVATKKTYISARLDPERDDVMASSGAVGSNILGRRYYSSVRGSAELSELVSESTEQIMAFTFDVRDDLSTAEEETVFGIKLSSLGRDDVGPTGMVLLYYDRFVDRPHWHGVNADIAIRLANCYKDLLVDRQRHENRGGLIRHEITQTSNAVGALMREAKRTAEFIRSQSRSLPASKDGATAALREASDRLKSMFDSAENACDLLSTQLHSIERADYADLNVFRGFMPEGIVRSQYTNIMQVIEGLRLQYKARFQERGLSFDFGSFPDDLYIRMRPEYVSYIFSNIFDNWHKYASANTVVTVKLSPRYNVIKRPDRYVLSFSNYIDTEVTATETETWFAYAKRSKAARESGKPGDGIGLFWIRRLLSGRFAIGVTFRFQKTGANLTRNRLSLELTLEPSWITTTPELQVGE